MTSTRPMTTQHRCTKNIRIEMHLAECPHQAELNTGEMVYCLTCNDIAPSKFIGTLLVSLDREGFLVVKTPLRVRK